MPQMAMDFSIPVQASVHIPALCRNGAKPLPYIYKRPFRSVSDSCFFSCHMNVQNDLENHLSLVDIFSPNLNVRQNESSILHALQEVDSYSDKTCVNLRSRTVSKSKEFQQNHLQEDLDGNSKFDAAKAISKNTDKASCQSTSDTLHEEIASAQNSSHYSEQNGGEDNASAKSDTFLSLIDGKEKFSYGQKKKKGGYQQGRTGCERGWLYFCLAVILLLIPLAEGVSSKCTVQEVYEGGSTNLTCKFEGNLNLQKKTVNVDCALHLTDSSTKRVVASLEWTYDGIQNRTRPGYELKEYMFKENETIIIIHIPEASNKFSGICSCELLGSAEEEIKTCELHVTEKGEALRRKTDKEEAVPIKVYAFFGIAFIILTAVFTIIIFVLCKTLQLNSRSAQHPSIETSLVNLTVGSNTERLQEESEESKDPLIVGISENENENDHQSDEEVNISLNHYLH